MDWGTHVVLAYKILEATGLEKGGAIHSNLPVIDSKPPEFHRVYAHIAENMPPILNAAMDIFGSKPAREGNTTELESLYHGKISKLNSQLEQAPDSTRRELEQKIYAYTRIVEEAPTFLKLTRQASSLVGDEEVTKLSVDKLSSGVSLITHLYFDTFNNPVQFFIPYSALPSAHWDLWEQIDYLKYREEFYKEKNINEFRKRIASDGIWNVKLKPEALLKAMIIRVGEQGRPAIPYEAIDGVIRSFLRYMGIEEYQRVDDEIAFLRKLENKIKDIISESFPKEEET